MCASLTARGKKSRKMPVFAVESAKRAAAKRQKPASAAAEKQNLSITPFAAAPASGAKKRLTILSSDDFQSSEFAELMRIFSPALHISAAATAYCPTKT